MGGGRQTRVIHHSQVYCSNIKGFWTVSERSGAGALGGETGVLPRE